MNTLPLKPNGWWPPASLAVGFLLLTWMVKVAVEISLGRFTIEDDVGSQMEATATGR